MKLLFICTHNRCRSILAEAITRHIAPAQFEVASAGSAPAGQVHPNTLKFLAEKHIATDGLLSQSWHDLGDFEPDVAITVCDSAAVEACPVWLGNAMKVHWGLPDPSKLAGDEQTTREAFLAVMQTIENRIKALAAIELAALSKEQLQTAFDNLAEQS